MQQLRINNLGTDAKTSVIRSELPANKTASGAGREVKLEPKPQVGIERVGSVGVKAKAEQEVRLNQPNQVLKVRLLNQNQTAFVRYRALPALKDTI